MIKHLVMFQLEEHAEKLSKMENASIIKEKLEALQNVIPEVQEIVVWINHSSAPAGNYDILLDATFNSFEDLKVYTDHPAHLEVVEYISKVKRLRAAVDYEV